MLGKISNENKKLNRDFYSKDPISVAKNLLGKILINKIDEKNLIKGLIVETEAYTGIDDKACQTFSGRRTERNETMWGQEGHAYVYMTYGIHYLLNVVTEAPELPSAVLIRAVSILNPSNLVYKNRYGLTFENLSKYQIKNLSNGPGKLTKAMGIDKKFNGIDLTGDKLYIEKGISDFEIVKSKRIGIDYAEEAKDYLYRFYIKGNKDVSKL